MEFSDLVPPKQVLPHREGTTQMPLKEFSYVKLNKIDLEMCRFCLRKSEVMLNIFDRPSELIVPIAEMIFLITGHHVSKGDSFPKNICRPCLDDATKALKIKQTYQRSHEFFCQLRKDSRIADNLLDKEACILSEAQQVVDIRERVEDDLLKKGEPYLDRFKVPAKTDPINGLVQEDNLECKDFQVNTGFEDYALKHKELDQCPVRNEPIEDDSSDEDQVNLFDSELKSEKTEDQSDSHGKTEGSRRNKCSHCSKSFKKLSQLKVHIILCHTEERPYKCSQCSSVFKTSHCLKRHVGTHTTKIKVKCDLCEKTFARARSLKIHRFYCSKSLEKLALLEKVRSRPYKCLECPKSFSEESDLTEHALTHSGEMTYVCSICNRPFIQKISLQRHLRWHKDERTFKCSQCPKSFLDEQQLNEHILTHQGINPFKCSQCPKSFLHKHSLDRHFRSHTGERPYKCSQCEKSFVYSYHLKLHTLAHSGESPYQCPHCPMSFFGKNMLENHNRTHTGERPFKCPHCLKDYTRKTCLQVHIRTHTGERPYKCDICQKTFTNNSALNTHMFTHRKKS